MLYLFELYGLVAVTVFGAAGVVILFLFGWFQLQALVAARHRISLASRLAISRVFSREDDQVPLTAQKSQ